jgi:hypothetical protein
MPQSRDRRSRFAAELTVLIVDDEETARSIACRMATRLAPPGMGVRLYVTSNSIRAKSA